jgi:hypothetical protein
MPWRLNTSWSVNARANALESPPLDRQQFPLNNALMGKFFRPLTGSATSLQIAPVMPKKLQEIFMTAPLLSVTREKHLDHLVRVIPFIVMLYAVQSYVLTRMAPGGFSHDHIVFLGVALCTAIGGFIFYNLKHRVDFFEAHLEISFLGYKRRLLYSQIAAIHVPEEAESFATITFVTAGKKRFNIYFVDEVHKLKQWVEEKQTAFAQAA